MRRRILQIILPITLACCTLMIVLGLLTYSATVKYQAATNQEIAGVVGRIILDNPEIDRLELIQAISGKKSNSAAIEIGEAALKAAGYLDGDMITQSDTELIQSLTRISIIIIIAMLISVGIYFWILDHCRECRIKKLVEYLQELKDRTYDLRLNENTEDELSLLSNEIYKIAVILKEAAENNREHSQNLEVALADISHQLRTPLTSLQVMIDNIYDDPNMPVSVRQDFLRSASRQIEGMSTLVTTLLNLAKFDNASIKLKRCQSTIGNLFQNVIQNLEVLAELQNVSLITTGDLSAKVTLDTKWQTEALTNIVKNCIEHSKSGTEVELNVKDCPLFLKITISDTGDGIAASDLHHIFERFYKTKNATTDSVGIGLSFAKAVIEADGGQISVKSKTNEGTKFIITYFK